MKWISREAAEKAVDEAAAALDGIAAGDNEIDHQKADAALCEFLRTIGCDAVADAWDRAKGRCGFWYS